MRFLLEGEGEGEGEEYLRKSKPEEEGQTLVIRQRGWVKSKTTCRVTEFLAEVNGGRLYGHDLFLLCKEFYIVLYESIHMQVINKLMYSGSSDTSARCWVTEFGDCTRVYLGHKHTVSALKFHDGLRKQIFFESDELPCSKD